MKYNKHVINEINTYLIPVKKKKYTFVHVRFMMPNDIKTLTLNMFLIKLLNRGSKKYPTQKDLAKKLDELYGLDVNVGVFDFGDSLNLYFDMKCFNEKYTEPNMLDKYLEYLNEVITNPLVYDNAFDKEKVEEIRRGLLDEITNCKANPGFIAKERFRNIFLPNTSYSIPYYGDVELINNVTGEELYEHYKYVINNSFVNIYVCGNIEEEKWIESINKNLKLNSISNLNINKYFYQKLRDEVLDITEEFPKKQSNIYMGFKIEDMTDFERYYVMKVFNNIFGSGSSSKLFTNVREKKSYCYAIGSSSSINYNILTVSSKIDAKNKENVIKCVYEELDNMKKGDFTEDKVEESKYFHEVALRSSCDKFSNIINFVAGKVIYGDDFPDERIEKIKKVTKKDVIKLANKIYPDTIYMLKGVEEIEKN